MIEIEEGRSFWTVRCLEVPSTRIANILVGIAVAGGLAFFGLRLALRPADWDWPLGIGIVLVCAGLFAMVVLRSPVTGVVAVFDQRTRLVQVTTHRGRASETQAVAFDDIVALELAPSGRDQGDQVIDLSLRRRSGSDVLLGRVRASGDVEPALVGVSEALAALKTATGVPAAENPLPGGERSSRRQPTG